MRRREFITLLGGAAVVWPLERGRQNQSYGVLARSGGCSATPRSNGAAEWLRRSIGGEPPTDWRLGHSED